MVVPGVLIRVAVMMAAMLAVVAVIAARPVLVAGWRGYRGPR